MHINHVTIVVKDKIASEKFFTEQLGFEKHLVGKSLWIKIGDQFIHVTQESNTPARVPFQHFGIAVDDVTTYIQSIIQRSVAVFDLDDQQKPIFYSADTVAAGRQFFVRDPDENLIEFLDENNPFFKG